MVGIVGGTRYNMTLKEFDKELELGWDNAIEKISKHTTDKSIKLLTSIYNLGYKSPDFNGEDVDIGLCFEIRKFVIEQIRKICQ